MDPFKPYEPKSRPVVLRLTRPDAEALALKAIAFVVGDDTLLSRFLALTGCGVDDLRTRLGDPSFLGAVLDFVQGDEGTAAAFSLAEGLAPETLTQARALLP
ncbi:MAG: DUF3572 domain-containing protein [Telmatospirillum sp.]|nr:DUF3572 domain-containing protein [Telmatospirillum sp.]